MPAILVEFAPMTTLEWGFFWASIACACLGVLLLPGVYRHGPLATYLAALCISWVPVQAIAYVAEGRRMWLPGQHSAVFFWGDSVALPLVAVSFSWMRRQWLATRPGPDARPLADRWAWRLPVLAAAIAISFAFHLTQVVSWSPEALHAPSKVWHDYLVYPVFLYMLGTQVPFIWQVPWSRRRIQPALVALALAGGLLWVWLGHVYDPWQAVERRPLLVVASGGGPPLGAVGSSTIYH